jgi:large subunit ribosomal protein L17
MRHRKAVDKLGRTAPHRKATLANLSTALFLRKHIRTTEAKAKATRRFSERLITLAKKQTLHARRLAARKLRNKEAVKVLFDEVAPQYTERGGGYTRVIKLGQRLGDGAHMAVLELVGFEAASKKKKEKDKIKEKETKAGATKKKKDSAKAEGAEEAQEGTKAKAAKDKAEKKKTEEKPASKDKSAPEAKPKALKPEAKAKIKAKKAEKTKRASSHATKKK